MGLFGGGNSSSTSADNRSDNSGNDGEFLQADNHSSIAKDGGVAVSRSNNTTVNITDTDLGAVEAGVSLATEALRSSERTFEDVTATLEDVTTEALESNTRATENALDFVEDSQAQAFSFSEKTTDKAFGFAEDSQAQAFSLVENITSQALDANASTALSALNEAGGIFTQAVEGLEARASASEALTSQALNSAEQSASNLSGALGKFGEDIAKANRSDGRELLEKMQPVIKWGSLAIIGTLILKAVK